MQTARPPPTTINDFADFWRYDIGVNVIPADTKSKRPTVAWSEFQNKPISEELHNQWKSQNKFSDGIAVILGKVWHNKQKQGLYLNGIDADNLKAIEEICSRNGKTISIKELAQWTLVEQHTDDINRAHIYVYSHKPFSKKSSDKIDTDLVNKLKSSENPAIEVKGLGAHGVLFCSPSVHSNGYSYQILGIDQPVIADQFEQHIDNICKKYGIAYLESGNGNGKSTNQMPIRDLFKPDFKVLEGHNRHEALLRAMDTFIIRNRAILQPEQIKQFAIEWNNKHCIPPLDDREFDRQWHDAVRFIARKNDVNGNGNGGINGPTSGVGGYDDDPPAEDLDMVQLTMQGRHFKTLKDTQEIFYYDEMTGIFVNDAQSIIQMQLESINPDISTYEVNEVINHIRRRTLTNMQEFDSQIEWVACKNCMINLKTLDTKPHDPDFMATMQIPIKYEPSSFIADFFEWIGDSMFCPCPAIMKFMHEVMAAEDVETILDFTAYCLWRAFPFHRYLLLNGSGRNGKGVMLEIIKRLLGHQNVSGESLHRLLENRFAAAELYGKLANIDADLSKEALKNTGILKKLTGGDYIPAEKKFLPAFKFVNYAKLLFSANEIPQTPDETDAFFARLIIVNFPNQFLGDKADPYLIDKLTTGQELSGLFSMITKRLPRVLSSGIYVPSSTIDENYAKYILSSNPVRAFVETAVDQQDTDTTSSKEEMYEGYKRFCKSKKLGIESEQSFSRKLKKEHGFNDIRMRDPKRGGIACYFWIGARLKDWTAVEGESEGQSTFS